MVALASPRDCSVPDVLPELRRPPLCAKLTPRQPREKPSKPSHGNLSARGGVPVPVPPVPVAPAAPLVGPGKTIASVLRSLPSCSPLSSELVCTAPPEEAASWPESKWRREKASGYGDGLISPRHHLAPGQLAPCPPANGPPSSGSRRPTRRTQSEGVGNGRPLQQDRTNAALAAPSQSSAAQKPRRTPRQRSDTAEATSGRRPSGEGYPRFESAKEHSNSVCSSPRRPWHAADKQRESGSPSPVPTEARRLRSGGGSSPLEPLRPQFEHPQSLPPLEQEEQLAPDDSASAEEEPLEAAQSSRRGQQSQGSVKQQAREWFRSFLLEAESEVRAEADAKEPEVCAVSSGSASSAAKPASSLIEEFEQERIAWEERTRKLLQSRGGFEEGNPRDLEDDAVKSREDRCSEGNQEFSDEAIKDTLGEGVECLLIDATELDEAGCQGSQIAAALLEAGFEPGLSAAHALAAAASESSLLQVVESTAEGDDDFDDSTRGKAQWAAPARQWAADRLRRKRERGLRSRAGTPCAVSVGLAFPSMNEAASED